MSSQHQSKFAFFKQSGWMVIATFGGGIFMSAVHTVAGHKMADAEYGSFVALLRLFIWLGIPSAGLQVVFAKQAAGALTEEKSRELSATVRGVLKATFYFWLALGALMIGARQWILTSLQISEPGALYLTVLLVLATLWLPIFKGILQGKHHFAGLGWLQIVDGIGRFGTICLILFLFHGQATGGIFSCLVGLSIALAIGGWLTRDIWRGPGASFGWKTWLSHAIPLTIGLGTIIFFSTADSLFVKSIFAQKDCPIYMAGNLTGFAIMQFVAPIASVMFPKVVQSMARSEKTDAVRLTIGVTAAVGICAALVCTAMPKLPLMILYFHSPERLAAAPLVPWFAWSLLPLTVSNVLLTSLLAQQRYAVVPWLVPIALGFLVTLWCLIPRLTHLPQIEAFILVVQMLGLFCLILAAVSAWFTWGKKS